MYLAKGKQNEIMYLPLLEGIVSVALTYAFVKTYGIYASAISLGISTILIMLIYSFKLIDISAIETSKGRYRLLLAGGPLILFTVITALVKLKMEFIDYEEKQLFLIFMLVILLIIANMIYKNVKIIKALLGVNMFSRIKSLFYKIKYLYFLDRRVKIDKTAFIHHGATFIIRENTSAVIEIDSGVYIGRYANIHTNSKIKIGQNSVLSDYVF